jgi:amidase
VARALPADPALWPATDQAAAVAARRLSARELLAAVTARIELHDPALNAVVTIDPDRAARTAAAADEATAHGQSFGPLHGLPMTMKDALAVAGLRSTGGAVELRDHVPDTDADVVARVRAAGANVFAKTNVPRWSGDLQTYNEVFGTTNNPWDHSLVPGGSSGGAATAVATGMTSVEVGTDIGGSVRVPAAYCGIAGHKPSYGLVPCGGYLDGVEGGLTEPDVNVHGPLARSVADLELLLGILAGPRPDRAAAWSVSLPAPRHDRIDRYRVAVWATDPACPVSSATEAATRAAGETLRGLGARVDDTTRPALDADAAARLGLALVGAAVTPSMTDEQAARVAASGGALSHRDWLAMDRARTRVRAAWAEFFTDVDVLVCPVIARPPFPHTQDGSFATRTVDVDGVARPYADLVWWTILIGMAYLPATSIPVGRTPDGLPIAVQVVGPYLEDRTALAVASSLLDASGGITLPVG